MGWEMCIRDSTLVAAGEAVNFESRSGGALFVRREALFPEQLGHCLLYTSDAADERSSVDLGGRRIIKKKKQESGQPKD